MFTCKHFVFFVLVKVLNREVENCPNNLIYITTFLSKHLVYLQLFCIIADGYGRLSGNRLLFLILHALLQIEKLCCLQEQIHFWWYSNPKSCNNIFPDSRPYRGGRGLAGPPGILFVNWPNSCLPSQWNENTVTGKTAHWI